MMILCPLTLQSGTTLTGVTTGARRLARSVPAGDHPVGRVQRLGVALRSTSFGDGQKRSPTCINYNTSYAGIQDFFALHENIFVT
jgi:hypothetical protein